MRLLLDAVAAEPSLHPEDRARLQAIADSATDPDDHSNPKETSAPPATESATRFAAHERIGGFRDIPATWL